MPVDVGFARASDWLLFSAVLVYAVAMLGYAAAFAFNRTARLARAAAQENELRASAAPVPELELAAVGGSGFDAGPVFGDGSTLVREPAVPSAQRSGSSSVGTIAVWLTALGCVLHIASVVFRGFAAHRAPWGNMYEFSSMIALIAVGAFLFIVWRYAVRDLGVFVMLPVVVYLGVAGTALYVPAGPLVPALHSYWIVIHVFAATSATGIFLVSAVANILFLVRERYERVLVAGGEPGFTRFAKSLPASANLDTLSYRLAAFAFPIWTFAIIAGAIWAESAWGRYWGWDPKETWSFITWVVFACYLHARATAGWKGRRAAYLALLGFGCFVFDFYGVNIWISGLHSYAGL